MTKLVVIGKSGQVATELQRKHLPPGMHLVALSRNEADITDPKSIASAVEFHRPDVLINVAAYTAVDRAESEWELAKSVNGIGPGLLAQTAASLNIPFIHVSTDYVFDGGRGKAWKESDAPAPVNAYGRSKLYGEQAALDSGARVVILRSSWVFSPYGANFVKTMINTGLKRSDIRVVKDQFGGPTGADDIAGILLRLSSELLRPEQDKLGIYHYSGKPAVSWAAFGKAIFDRADWLKPSPVITAISSDEYPTAAQRPVNSVLDCSKIFHDYGIAQPDWQQSLARTIGTLRAEYEGISR
jgi:dTDP-4-dehydrorhamnose reductase